MINIASFKTKFGWIIIKEKNNHIVSISFGKKIVQNKNKKLEKIIKIISQYFEGNRLNFNMPLLIEGTNIQKRIWKEIKKIPYGQTRSYGEISKKIGCSPRYIGKVCGQNEHLIIIPCHRVIRSDGQLGGYSSKGGINLKKKLLSLEKIKLS